MLIISLSIIVFVQANPSLDIIAKTDKQEYYARETVQIYGNLTLDGVPVTNGLVGLQIQTSQGELITIRTVPANNPPPETPYIFVEYVVPCDINGNPKFSFRKGTLAYFKIRVSNADIQPRNACMTIETYYGDNTPFGHAATFAEIVAKSNPIFIISIPIPNDATIGTATVYGNAYTNWPKFAGTPHCSEVNSTFEITDGTLGAPDQTTQEPHTLETNETQNFNLTFRLPKRTYGNCTVYATSRHGGESVFNSTTFEVFMLGDIGGPVGYPPVPTFFAFDGKVDGYDLALFIECYKKQAPPEAMYLGDIGGPVGYPIPIPTFFAFDGKVDGYDLALFIQIYKGLGP